MSVEDNHYAVSMDVIRNGIDLFGIDYLDGNTKSFLCDLDPEHTISSGFSKSQMNRFGEAAGLIKYYSARSKSMVSFSRWVYHVSWLHREGQLFYSDLCRELTDKGYAAYDSESVRREYALLAEVRVDEIARLFADHAVEITRKIDFENSRNIALGTIKRCDNSETPNAQSAILNQKNYIEYHCRDLNSFKTTVGNRSFDRFYHDLSSVIELWKKASIKGLGVFITRF